MNSNGDTIVIPVDPDHPEPAAIARAAEVLRRGGLVAFPTETVYGLGANALDAAAVARIFAAKGRPTTDPLIVHIADRAMLDLVAADVPELARELARVFWPGPLTLVLRRRPAISLGVTAGRETVAVRMPAHAVALALVAAAGVPVAAPSANLFTRPSPTQAGDVLEDLVGRVDMILDGGPTPIGIESTVLDMTQSPPRLLRPGGVPAEAIRQHVPALRYDPQYVKSHDQAHGQVSPGMLLKHYSPRAELRLLSGTPERALERMRAMARAALAAGQRVGVLAPDEEAAEFAALGAEVAPLGPAGDLARIGRRIFAGMRELDRRGVALILVRGVAREGLGLAIWDRLLRAAEGRVIDVDEA